MKNLWVSLPVILILLAGCKTATLLMRVDPALESNASVYEVKSPDVWSAEKKLNVSFGAYRVSDMDISWTTTGDTSSPGSFLTDVLYEVAGVKTGGDDDSIREVTRSLSYAFSGGDKVIWNADCVHLVEEREYEERVLSMGNKNKGNETVTRVDILSSRYTCRYTRASYEEWVLSIERRGAHTSSLEIGMTDGEEYFTAHATAGKYIMSDGSKSRMLRPPDMGYTWKHGDNSVAAISVKESNPKVWLDKRNSKSTNHVLAMASAGLLIYERKIAPTVKTAPLFR